MKIDNCEIARTESIKILRVLRNENLSRKTRIKYIENKISKNIGILFQARSFLNKKSLLSLYYSYIQSYTNCGSVCWGTTCRANPKKSQQEHVFGIIFNKGNFEHTNEFLKSSNILPLQRLCIKFKENLHQEYFFWNSENPLIHLQHDSQI